MKYLPPSVNGFVLIAKRPLATWFVVPSWSAPFFTLTFDDCDDEQPIAPMLYHAEDLDSARSVGRKVFDSQFAEI